eukprot:5476376-Pyramimonas_sp.AAC.1
MAPPRGPRFRSRLRSMSRSFKLSLATTDAVKVAAKDKLGQLRERTRALRTLAESRRRSQQDLDAAKAHSAKFEFEINEKETQLE